MRAVSWFCFGFVAFMLFRSFGDIAAGRPQVPVAALGWMMFALTLGLWAWSKGGTRT